MEWGRGRSLRGAAGRAALLFACVSLFADAASAQFTQGFTAEGPGPISGLGSIISSQDAPPNGTSTGAVSAVLTDPGNVNKMIIGAPNGGVWTTLNGGQSWTAQSDKASSLSIASLA